MIIIEKSAKTWQRIDSQKEREDSRFVDELFDETGRWTPRGAALVLEEEPALLDIPEFNDLMEKCISDLPEKWRIAVLSRYMLEKKGKDISKELEITPSNYWQMLHRAKLFLKICLEKYWDS